MTTELNLASAIQHTLIDFAVDRPAMDAHCRECVDYGFNAAMVPAIWVPYVADVLRGTGVLVASAIDFPYGCMTTPSKVSEAVALQEAGADQLDLGVHVGLLRSGMLKEFEADIAAVVQAVDVPVKVMLELPRLRAEERDLAVDLAVAAGAQWVKNASGGAAGKATPEDIEYLRRRAPETVGVKASGGISTAETVRALLAAGASLVGTSAGVAIVTGEAADVLGAY